MKQDDLYISICIPCYEMGGMGKAYLGRLFNSIQDQDYERCEIIVSDHSSDDVLQELCEEWRKLLRIRYVKNERGRGNASININEAIRLAEGDVIKPMHQDDFFYSPECLRAINNILLANPNYMWGGCGFIHTNDDESDFFKPQVPVYQDDIVLAKNTFGAPSVFFYRNTSPPELFDEKLIWINDCELAYRFYAAYGSPLILSDLLVAVRIWEARVTERLLTPKLQKQELRHTQNKYNIPSRGRRVFRKLFLGGWGRIRVLANRIIREGIYYIETFSGRDDLLTRLCNRYGIDKGTRKIFSWEGERHWYAPVYHRYFASRRHDPLRILEIGVGGGESLTVWSRYFPRAHIYALDINDCSRFNTERITCFRGDQSNREDLKRMLAAIGEPIDIIIDDGGHYMNQQQISMGVLFRSLKRGGVYCIEDLHTSYWPLGDNVSVYGNIPIDTNEDKSNTTLSMIRRYQDEAVIISPFLFPEEEEYLSNNIARCIVHDTAQNKYGPNHMAVFTKS